MSANKNGKRNLIHRQVINLDTKMKIIRKHEDGQGITSIARELRYAPSTINTIVKDAARIREHAKRNASMKAKIITKIPKGTISDVEELLLIWIKDQTEKQLPLNKQLIQAKAKSLFQYMKSKYPHEAHNFSASASWFSRFKNRVDVILSEDPANGVVEAVDDEIEMARNDDKATIDDVEVAKQYPEWLKKIIDERSYLKEQIFTVNETGLFYHKMPSRTYIAKEEKTMSGPKASRKRVALLLGGNASGSFKLKPLLVHTTANPHALKGITKATLPVHFRSTNTARITAAVFEDWFVNSFSSEVEKYCHENKLPFKILLILDNSPSHPINLGDISSNIKVEYLPIDTSSLLHPMNQGVISTFKAYYMKRMLAQAINALDSNSDLTLPVFWKEYNIYEAIKNIAGAWAEVTENCIKGAWKKLTPHLASDFRRPTDNNETFDKETTKIVKLAEKLQLDVKEADVKELIEAHDEELTKEELTELAAAKIADNEQNDVEETERNPKHFTVDGMIAAMQSLNNLYEALEKQDPDVSRFLQFQRIVDDAFSNYRKVYEEKKKASVQTSFDKFVLTRKQGNEPSTSTHSVVGQSPSASGTTSITIPASAPSECDTVEDLTPIHSPYYSIKMEEEDLDDPLSIVHYIS